MIRQLRATLIRWLAAGEPVVMNATFDRGILRLSNIQQMAFVCYNHWRCHGGPYPIDIEP